MTPDAAYLRWIRRTLPAWYDRHRRDLPWRRTTDPYAVWLSEAMLQQTQVATVLPYYERFRTRFLTVRDLAEADEDEVLHIWAGLGYYSRARNLHRAAQVVVTQFGGRFPETVEELRRLPGVGRYIAGAVASIAFDARVPVVDGNVIRVFARLFGLCRDVRDAAGRETIWRLAETLLPKSRCGDFNQAIMELGATVCLPGKAARCTVCPLRAKCSAYAAGSVARLPIKTRRQTPKSEIHVVAAIERDDRWLFVRRPTRGLWGGLWEMPSEKVVGRTTAAVAAEVARKATATAAWEVHPRPFCDFRHSLTHRTIRFVGHICRTGDGGSGSRRISVRPMEKPNQRASAKQNPAASQWLSLEDVGLLGLSRAMQKVTASLRAATSAATE